MAQYLDETQRKAVARLRTTRTWRSEWPTWVIIVTIYSGWFGVATHARNLGLPIATLLLVPLSTWYMSLQHELIHGHPTRSGLINSLLGFAPLAVWFPYPVYRDSHLRHHDDPHLTRPECDPESYFISAHTWHRAGPFLQALLLARTTFVGRLLVGPAFAIGATLSATGKKLVRGDGRDLPVWLAHGVSVAALAVWLDRACGIPVWLFLGMGYAALALGAIRSFHEHRAADCPAHRTAINETTWFWRLIFLNNNYHLVHHDLPHVPWFALREVYETSRQQYIERSGGFLVKGYSEWARRYAFVPVTHPVHGHQADIVLKYPCTSARLVGKLRVKTNS